MAEKDNSMPPLSSFELEREAHFMSNLTFFIVLSCLLFFPGPAPADAAEPIEALCARHGLQLRETQEEMTVRDIAAATGIKQSTLRQLLKGLAKEGEIRCRR